MSRSVESRTIKKLSKRLMVKGTPESRHRLALNNASLAVVSI
jgi:hypothetical protein